MGIVKIFNKVNLNKALQSKYLKLIFYLLILLFTFRFFYIILSHSFNIPINDEYASLGLLLHFLADRISIFEYLFHQYNAHRLFLFNSILLLQIKLANGINFQYIILFGSLSVVGIMYLFFKENPVFSKNFLLITPVILILMVPLDTTHNFSIVVICIVVQMFLVYLALFLLSKRSLLMLSASILLSGIVTFSFGNGWFTFFVGYIILFLEKKRSYKRILIWTFSMLMILFFYFYNYDFNKGSQSYNEITGRLDIVFVNFISFFGCFLKQAFRIKPYIMTITGFIILFLFLYLVLKKWSKLKKFHVMFSFQVFLILSGAMASLARSQNGLYATTGIRYSFYPILFIVCLYIMWLSTAERLPKLMIFLVVLISIAFNIRTTKFSSSLMDQKTELVEKGIIAFINDPNTDQLYSPFGQRASVILDNSIKKGIYKLPELKFKNDIKQQIFNIESIQESDNIRYHLDKFSFSKNNLELKGWAFLKTKNKRNQQIGVVLKSNNKEFILSSNPVERVALYQRFKDEYSLKSYNSGFSLNYDISQFDLSKGQYKIGICIIDHEKMIGLKYTSHMILVE